MSTPTLTLLHGRNTHKVPFEGTLSDLQAAIHAETDIPPAEQQLIHRGKKLALDDPSTPVTELGLSTLKAMLMHHRPSAPAAPDALQPIRDADKRAAALSDALREADGAVSRHTQGFLDADQTRTALERDERDARTVEEGCMRLLEALDGMQAAPGAADAWRAERKAVVARVQAVLVGVDGLRERIEQLKSDNFGEVQRRRGNR